MAIKIDRLKSQLLASQLQVKDPALYQVINQLIGYLKDTANSVEDLSGSGTLSGSTVVNNNYNYANFPLPLDGEDGIDGLTVVGPTGPRGLNGLNGTVGPGFIPEIELDETPELPLPTNIPIIQSISPRTDTGAVNNWNPPLAGDTLILWSGAADATITGLAGGYNGRTVTIKNTGTKVIYFTNQSASSSVGNRFSNLFTSQPTPVAPKGYVSYQYDGTNWQVIAYDQGAWITVPFNAADFTGNGTITWTVDPGDVTTQAYKIVGNVLSFAFVIDVSTTVAPAGNALWIHSGAWGGYSIKTDAYYPIGQLLDNFVAVPGILYCYSPTSYVIINRLDSGNFTPSVNANYMRGTPSFEIL